MAAPVFTSLTPSHGPQATGASVAVVGSGFDLDPDSVELHIDPAGLDITINGNPDDDTNVSYGITAFDDYSGPPTPGVAYDCRLVNSEGNSNTLVGAWKWDVPSGRAHKEEIHVS